VSKDWYVYVLECGGGSLYTGVTVDVDTRVKAHAEGKGSKYVYRRGVRGIVRCKKCKNKVEAHKEEYRIKQLPRNLKLAGFD